MTWLRIDDGFVEHPKVYDLSDRSFRLHVAALCYSARNLTDGLLDKKRIAVLCAITKAKRHHISELVDAELWTRDDENGYTIRDYLHYNPDAETVKKRRSEARDRMATLRGSHERSHEQNGEVTANVRTPRPVPSPTRPKEQDPKPIARIEEVQVWEAWTILAPPLIAHRESYFSAPKTRSAIAGALRLYPVDDVAEAVRSYAAVLGGSEYRWDHSWTLIDFLKRGLDKFVPEARPLENFGVKVNGNGGPSRNAEILRLSSERWQREHPE